MNKLLALTLALLSSAVPSAAQTAMRWAPHREMRDVVGPHMVYDEARERTVAFGGREWGEHIGFAEGTWEWDGMRWNPRQDLSVEPPARSDGAMVYDAARRRSVLFGGNHGNGVLANDTWEYDGRAWSRVPTSASPPARSHHALAFDRLRGRTVLFGGLDAVGNGRDETWEYDGATWVQRFPAHSPGSWLHAGMAYDEVRGRTVLLVSDDQNFNFETWEWDGSDWTAKTGVQPSFSIGHHRELEYVAHLQRVAFHAEGRIWIFDGNDWTAAPTAAPLWGWTSDLAYDRRRQELLVYGFEASPQPKMFAWDGVTWTLRDDTDRIFRIRDVGGALAKDEASGGFLTLGIELFYNGWCWASCYHTRGIQERWDGERWTGLELLNVLPFREFAALVGDPVRGEVLLFGGGLHPGGGRAPYNLFGDTWSWDGRSWTEHPTDPGLTARMGHRMVYDESRDETLLFGGAENSPSVPSLLSFRDDTWIWNGSSRRWTPANPSTIPPPRWNHALVYDPYRARTVLFGGQDGNGDLADTWEWDGIDWTRVISPVNPPARSSHAMAWDPSRLRVVMYGGSSNFSDLSDVWEWDGSVWSPVPMASSIPAMSRHAMHWDTQRQAHFVVGPTQRVIGSTHQGWLGDLAVPASTSFGSGCGASPPELWAPQPTLGFEGFRLEVSTSQAITPVLIGVAITQVTTPLGGSCSWYLGSAWAPLIAVTNDQGMAGLELPIPIERSLRGASLFVQAFDGSGLSAGRQLVIGD